MIGFSILDLVGGDMTVLFVLLVVYQVKHFLADFPLQNGYMLQKFKEKGWVGPLSAHAGVHAGFTFVISLVVLLHTNGGFMWAMGLAVFDFAIHFTMDRIKASPEMLGRYKALSASEFKASFNMASYKGRDGELSMARNLGQEKLKSNTYFWWALGIDQMVHHITHYAIIFILMFLTQ